ncbi:MAG TPA: CsbD family protein [Candidatus Angelobacter sp.]|nr:CsbD family protein [Candidatus Angelobacter sp.]
MDKDRVKGKMEDLKGRVKRQAGEWTGDSKLQAEGIAEQAKGKARNAVGRMKDAARDISDDMRKSQHRKEPDEPPEKDEAA